MDLYKVVRSPIDNAVTPPGPDHRSSPSFAEPIRHDLVKNTQIADSALGLGVPLDRSSSRWVRTRSLGEASANGNPCKILIILMGRLAQHKIPGYVKPFRYHAGLGCSRIRVVSWTNH
jgi:hypothetical protein